MPKTKRNQKSFYAQIVYPTLVMLIISSVVTGAIAIVTELTQDKIDIQSELRIQKAVLSALSDENRLLSDAAIIERYEMLITEKNVKDTPVFIAKQNDRVIGIVVEMNGPALWGNVQGFFAISADMKTLLGVDFVAHSETPGLGGRIDELWFKKQFRDVPIPLKSPTVIIRPAENGKIDGITGATLTVNAIRDMVNAAILEALDQLKGVSL